MYQGWLMLRVQKLFEDNPVSGRRYLSGIPSRCLPNTMVRFCSEIEFSLPCYSVNDVQTVSLAFESDELDFGFANLFLLFHYQTNTTNRITPGLSSCWFLIYIDFLYFYIIYDNDVLKYLTRSGGPCPVACLGRQVPVAWKDLRSIVSGQLLQELGQLFLAILRWQTRWLRDNVSSGDWPVGTVVLHVVEEERIWLSKTRNCSCSNKTQQVISWKVQVLGCNRTNWIRY